ncbi:MAG: class IV adenylate cyclase [Acidobacteriales bacterium]|nr:class IV adenylate cyclase [Terriglobales bacterium]
MPQETEIKFQVANPRQLTRKLKALGFRPKTPRTHEMNTLYDFPGQPLRARGELLRLRQYGPKWTVTHKAKGKAGRHKSRVETETTVSNGENAEAIFQALGLEPIFRYEKFRAEWSDGAGHLVLDQTPVGTYAELEGPARWIDRTAKRLGLSSADYITKTYAELFQDWKRRTGSPAEEMTFRAARDDERGPRVGSG